MEKLEKESEKYGGRLLTQNEFNLLNFLNIEPIDIKNIKNINNKIEILGYPDPTWCYGRFNNIEEYYLFYFIKNGVFYGYSDIVKDYL